MKKLISTLSSPLSQKPAPASSSTMSTPPPSEEGNSPKSEKSKQQQQQSQARRAQVRSAQIRHRQRKANYISELEHEVSEYRDLIDEAQKASDVLRDENEAMRTRLAALGVQADAGLAWDQQQTQQLLSVPSLQMVTLAMDDAMGTPSFSISSSSESISASDYASHATFPETGQSHHTASPYNDDDDVWLTAAQEETAVNFILALEHICWDHFPSDHSITHRVLQTVTNEGSGHTLMASSLAMASAPESVYKNRRSLHHSSCASREAQAASSGEGTSAAASAPDSSEAPSPSKQSQSSSPFQWTAPRISLQHLAGLASSLNPGDLELTPVQAWFELADRYPVALLLEGPGTALETLKRELRGLVKCLHYGAVIERMAFESVVSRVMDVALWNLQPSLNGSEGVDATAWI